MVLKLGIILCIETDEEESGSSSRNSVVNEEEEVYPMLLIEHTNAAVQG